MGLGLIGRAAALTGGGVVGVGLTTTGAGVVDVVVVVVEEGGRVASPVGEGTGAGVGVLKRARRLLLISSAVRS